MNDFKINEDYLLLVGDIVNRKVNTYKVHLIGQGTKKQFFALTPSQLKTKENELVKYDESGIQLNYPFEEYLNSKEHFNVHCFGLKGDLTENDQKLLSLIDVHKSVNLNSITLFVEDKEPKILDSLKTPFEIIPINDKREEVVLWGLFNKTIQMNQLFNLIIFNLKKFKEMTPNKLTGALVKLFSSNKVKDPSYLVFNLEEGFSLKKETDFIGFNREFNEIVLSVDNIQETYTHSTLEYDSEYYASLILETVKNYDSITKSVENIQTHLKED